MDKITKKALKQVAKKIPGPIGSVARLSDMPRKISNAVKNAKTLKKVPKRKPGQPRNVLGKVPKGVNMSQKEYNNLIENALTKGIKKGKELRTIKETKGKAVATDENIDRVRYGKKSKTAKTMKAGGIVDRNYLKGK
jgi:hypothetical protein|tara:strand:- start:36 stop:446 length:411 start_codon:yes stop_codon:yes gene_type:complete